MRPNSTAVIYLNSLNSCCFVFRALYPWCRARWFTFSVPQSQTIQMFNLHELHPPNEYKTRSLSHQSHQLIPTASSCWVSTFLKYVQTNWVDDYPPEKVKSTPAMCPERFIGSHIMDVSHLFGYRNPSFLVEIVVTLCYTTSWSVLFFQAQSASYDMTLLHCLSREYAVCESTSHNFASKTPPSSPNLRPHWCLRQGNPPPQPMCAVMTCDLCFGFVILPKYAQIYVETKLYLSWIKHNVFMKQQTQQTVVIIWHPARVSNIGRHKNQAELNFGPRTRWLQSNYGVKRVKQSSTSTTSAIISHIWKGQSAQNHDAFYNKCM